MLPGRRERENGGRGERGSRNEVVFIRRVFWRAGESATRDIPKSEGRGQYSLVISCFFVEQLRDVFTGFVDSLEESEE